MASTLKINNLDTGGTTGLQLLLVQQLLATDKGGLKKPGQCFSNGVDKCNK